MANIRKIEGKTGTSYKITVTAGRDMEGKQIRHFLTWKPAPGMTERQIAKAVQKAAMDFEQQIEQGFIVDNRQTFAEYADYVLKLKERAGAKHRTIYMYKDLLVRINKAIGHLKLCEIRPQHLNSFYNNLSEKGLRVNKDRAYAAIDLSELLISKGFTRDALAKAAGVSPTTITAACRNQKIKLIKAEVIAKALNKKTTDIFKIERDTSPLSNKTILEYHRLISTIMDQADKEMLIPFNPASKATPPKQTPHEVNYFQPMDISKILTCLDEEPIKWRTAVHLLIITGCRRGEIAGLKWSKVDFENSQIKVDTTLLYSCDIGVYEDTTKTRTTRFVKLPAETMVLLKKYQSWYLELKFKNGDQWHDTGYVFVQDNGKPMHPDSLTSWLGHFAKRHGLPHINPHAFRHTMASILINNGKDIVSVSKRLGHARTSTTIDIYSHIIKEADELAADCIADVVLRRNNA